MNQSPVLEIDNLSVKYQSRRRRSSVVALQQVSLKLFQGETLGIVGESGSGKSTLGNAVLGLVPITDGTISWRGEEITSASGSRRRLLSREIQAIFQDPYSTLNPQRTVGQSILETLAGSGEERSSHSRERVISILEQVGLDKSAFERYPRQFSGGQRQRIAIARAILPSPSLVICDEVVSALDLSVQAQVMNLLNDLQVSHGLSYLFITHDLSVVRHLCHRTMVLKAGNVIEEGPTEVVLNTPSDPYTQRLVMAAPVLDPEEQQRRRESRRSPAQN